MQMKNWRLILIIVIVVLFIGASFVLFAKKGLVFSGKNNQENIRQAIFLANGQVYFGEVETENNRYLIVRSIYYLKAQDQLDANNPDKKISIIKLGDELHGPEDKMYINRTQVLFYENMRKDSKINEAINRFIENKNKI